MARQSWAQKVANALSKLSSGVPLGKQTSVPAPGPEFGPAPSRAQMAAARGHRAGEYHYGRVTTIKSTTAAPDSLRVGPVPDPSGKTYRNARPPTYDHVLKMLRRLPPGRIVLYVYGDMGKSPGHIRQPEEDRFEWIAKVRDRDDLIDTLEHDRDDGISMEKSVQGIFDLENTPELILAWQARPAPLGEK